MDKSIRMVKALAQETGKRIPWILITMGAILILQGIQNASVARENSADSKTLLQRVASLSEDNKRLAQGNQALTKQNNELAQAARNHTDCLAQLFARYTQTRTAIMSVDLNSCTTSTEQSVQSASTAQAVQTPSNSLGPQTPSTTPQETPTTPQLPPSQSFLRKQADTITNLLHALTLGLL